MVIYLFCSAGMSTSLLVKKMQKEAEAKGLNFEIEAYPESTVSENGERADVILLGPQIRFKEKAIKAEFPHKPVAAIDMAAYGLINGKAVLETAIKMFNDKQHEISAD